jgi:hypothetical protein
LATSGDENRSNKWLFGPRTVRPSVLLTVKPVVETNSGDSSGNTVGRPNSTTTGQSCFFLLCSYIFNNLELMELSSSPQVQADGQGEQIWR